MSMFISRQLKYFMVTMKTRCISRAAEELCLTRSPLCKKLTDLENSLGMQLFVRKYNELEPTQYADELYDQLLPLYEMHLSLENTLKVINKRDPLTFIFDITIPELLYRNITSLIQAKIHTRKFKCQRMIVCEQSFSEHNTSDNIIYILLRPVTLSGSYKQIMWMGSEVTLLHPKNKNVVSGSVDVYLWKDNYIDYFKTRIEKTFNNNHMLINYISHNLDLTAILYNIYQGCGGCFLPLKTALVYKNDSVQIQPFAGKNIPVYMYYNNEKNYPDELEVVKKILKSVI